MRYLTIILFTAGLVWMLPQNGQAQLLEVKQTVYGMDCAPCAYALENRINNMEGVHSASVSLNDGLLTTELAEENILTLLQIRKAVEESGFSPREAEIKVTGTLKKEKDQYVIVTPSGDKYAIHSNTVDTEKQLKKVEDGETITLSGQISQETKETDYWTLAVDTI